MNGIRADKWLWAVRVFKTRSLASEACKKGHAVIGQVQIKPSRLVKPEEIMEVRKNGIRYRYRILALTEKRLPAKDVHGFIEDITPREELDKLLIRKEQPILFQGKGRPTKRDRRLIDKLKDNSK